MASITGSATDDAVQDFYQELTQITTNCSFYFFDAQQPSLCQPVATYTCPMRRLQLPEILQGDAEEDENIMFQAATPHIRRISTALPAETEHICMAVHVTGRNPYTQMPLLIAQSPLLPIREISSEVAPPSTHLAVLAC